MKLTVLLLASAVAAQAAVVEFDLSPLDTDVDVGLSPSNAVPAVTNSTGSGDKLPGNNLYLDTDSGMLMIGIGYGSAGGFSDLTGVATAAHIHGPANSGEATNVLVDLAPIHFVQITNPASGGIIHGAIDLAAVSTNAMQELMDGLWYVNIHTATNPAGEIRGQLIMVNLSPQIMCSGDVTNLLGETTETEVFVMDANGDDLTLAWSSNGVPQTPLMIPGDAAMTGTNIVIEAEYPEGTNVLAFDVSDPHGATNSCSTTIVVVKPNAPPVIVCPEPVTAECGDAVTSTVAVSDEDGDDVVVMWWINGETQQPVMIPGDAALAGTNIVIEIEYPLGTNVLRFLAIDSEENSSRCATLIVVEDTIPPVIARASADPSSLWPPNHKMVAVNVSARVEDACGGVRWRIAKVTSNEPLNDTGDGNTEQDWNIVDRDTVELRAERSGNLEGRVYTIWLEARDGAGNEAEPKSVKVTVPHDQGKKKSKRSRWW